jgi:hypothetical protein
LERHLKSCHADRPLKAPVKRPDKKTPSRGAAVQKAPPVISPEKIDFHQDGDSGGSKPRVLNKAFAEQQKQSIKPISEKPVAKVLDTTNSAECSMSSSFAPYRQDKKHNL